LPNRAHTRWSKEDTLIAFNLFCKTSIREIKLGNPEIIALAEKLGRSPGSVRAKMFNFASFDPIQRAKGRVGLPHASRTDQLIWEEFNENPKEVLLESQLLAGGINDEDNSQENIRASSR